MYPCFFFKSALMGEEAFDPWNTNPIPQLNSEQDPEESQAWRDQTSKVASVAAGFSRSARSPISEEVLEALRSADRKGRDVVVGLSNACCKWGCSKSEISSLCWTLSLKYTSCPVTNAELYSFPMWVLRLFTLKILHAIQLIVHVLTIDAGMWLCVY